MSGKAIGEALAALGVIASMIFVGLEIRQSNAQARAQARAAAYQAIGVATAEVFDSWAHDPELFETRYKGAAAMDPTDWQRWALKVTGVARLGETLLLQVEQDILPPDAMDRLGYGGWKKIFDDPKYGCVWPLIRPGVGASFREFVEEGQDPKAIDCSGFVIPPRP